LRPNHSCSASGCWLEVVTRKKERKNVILSFSSSRSSSTASPSTPSRRAPSTPPTTWATSRYVGCLFHRFESNNANLGGARVARWFIFRPKIAIWVNFGGSCNGRCWYILWTFGLFYNHLINVMAI
jgi:hypothetical protein